jgi:hypothetical protein
MIRKGRSTSQTSGYKTRARMATGQQRINRSSHTRNFAMHTLPFVKYGVRARGVPGSLKDSVLD